MRKLSFAWSLAFILSLVVAFTGVEMPPVMGDGVGTGGVFVPVSNAKLVDTTGGVGGSSTAFSAGETRTYQAGGVAGIPTTGVAAVLVDLAATSTTSIDNAALIGPSGVALPNLAALRFNADTVPRSTTVAVALGADGKLQLKNQYGTTNYTVVVLGYFTSVGASGPAPGGFVSLKQTTLADSKTGAGLPTGQLNHGVTQTIQATGQQGIPSDATAVFVSLLVTYINTDGNLRLNAADQPMATLSSMEYSAGGPEQTGLLVPLSADGKFNVTNMGADGIHARFDVEGYVSGDPTKGGGYTPLSSTKIFDSGTGSTALHANESRTFTVAGVAGMPAQGIGAVMMTVIAENYTQGGGVEVYNADEIEPNLTDVYFYAIENGADVSGTTVVRPSAAGRVTVKNLSSGPVEVRIIAQGWFAGTGEPQEGEVDPNPADGDSTPENYSDDPTTPEDVTLPPAGALPDNSYTENAAGSRTYYAESSSDPDPAARAGGTWWDGQCTSGESRYTVLKLYPRANVRSRMVGGNAIMYCGITERDGPEAAFGLRHVRYYHKSQFAKLAAWNGTTWGNWMHWALRYTLGEPDSRADTGPTRYCYLRKFYFTEDGKVIATRYVVAILGKTGRRIITAFPSKRSNYCSERGSIF